MQRDGHRSHIGGTKRWIRNKIMRAIIEQQVKTWNHKYAIQPIQTDESLELELFESIYIEDNHPLC
jgi:hypothetical protein